MLQRSAENRHLRPIATYFEGNPRAPHSLANAEHGRQPIVSRRSFAAGLMCLLLVHSLFAQQRPRRIVSTAPSVTEALFALALGNQVVGVSQFCNYPSGVANLPKVGSYIKPNAEAIARLAPDFVILQIATPNRSTSGAAKDQCGLSTSALVCVLHRENVTCWL